MECTLGKSEYHITVYDMNTVLLSRFFYPLDVLLQMYNNFFLYRIHLSDIFLNINIYDENLTKIIQWKLHISCLIFDCHYNVVKYDNIEYSNAVNEEECKPDFDLTKRHPHTSPSWARCWMPMWIFWNNWQCSNTPTLYVQVILVIIDQLKTTDDSLACQPLIDIRYGEGKPVIKDITMYIFIGIHKQMICMCLGTHNRCWQLNRAVPSGSFQHLHKVLKINCQVGIQFGNIRIQSDFLRTKCS